MSRAYHGSFLYGKINWFGLQTALASSNFLRLAFSENCFFFGMEDDSGRCVKSIKRVMFKNGSNVLILVYSEQLGFPMSANRHSSTSWQKAQSQPKTSHSAQLTLMKISFFHFFFALPSFYDFIFKLLLKYVPLKSSRICKITEVDIFAYFLLFDLYFYKVFNWVILIYVGLLFQIQGLTIYASFTNQPGTLEQHAKCDGIK